MSLNSFLPFFKEMTLCIPLHKFGNFLSNQKLFSFHLSTNILCVILFFLNFSPNIGFAQSKKPAAVADKPIELAKDSLAVDSAGFRKDSTKISLKQKKKGDINTTVIYSAQDSIQFDAIHNEVFLFGDAKITYGDINLKSDRVKINWKKNLMEAHGSEDSTGKMIGQPIFKQGGDVYNAETIGYNFKTKKGIIGGIVTQQGEGYIHGHRVKKNQYDEMFVKDAKYTTCNMAHPHFYIDARKVKMVPGKQIVTGPFNMVVEDVPVPLGFIFGMFPMPKSKSAGILMPTYGQSAQQGFFLQNGGVYIPIGDYVGIRAIGNIWTVGSYGVQVAATYKLRYNFSGNLNFTMNNRVNPSYIADNTPQSSRDWALTWSHTPDSKGKSSTFSASVNIYTPAFNRNNSFNTNNYISSSFSSNINYTKTFKGTPFNMSIAARQDQNTVTKIENYNLPDISVNMNRQTPFQNLKGINKNLDFIKKLNIAYTFNFRNSFTNSSLYVNTTAGSNSKDYINPLESNFNINNVRRDTSSFLSGNIPFKEVLSLMNNGITHTIPISTTIKLLKYFSLNPSFNFKSVMYKDHLDWFTIKNKAKTYDSTFSDTINHHARMINTYSFSAGLTTRVYGTFYIKKFGIEAIRHTLMPTVSYTFAPDFSSGNFQNSFWGAGYQQLNYTASTPSGFPQQTISQSAYNDPRYIMGGSPSKGMNNSLGLSLQNTFEMKVKEKNDTTKKFKKVSLLDNLSLSTSYNFSALVNQWAPIQLNARTNILGLINLNFTSTFDEYLYIKDTLTGTKTRSAHGIFDNFIPANKLETRQYSNNSKFLNLTNINVSASLTLNPATFKKLMNKKEEELTDEEKELKKRIKNNPTAYVDFNVPWNLSMMFNYIPNLGYNGPNQTDAVTLQFNGDFRLTPKWKIQYSSGYNFVQKVFTAPRFTIYRDLHCWQMNLTWIPFGPQQMYSMDIGIKATILQDLKYNKRRNDWFDNVGQ